MTSKDETKSTPVQRFSWKKASNLLTETEKNRICCLLLTCFEHIKPTGEDFELAAAQFGAAKGGFTKMYQTTVKKLKDANAYIVEGESVEDIPTPATGQQTPKTPKKTPGSKRKADAGGEVEGTPTKKARAPRKVKAEPEAKTEVEADGEADDVKKEVEVRVEV